MAGENGARLVATLEARVNKFERDLARANGTARREFGAIERRASQMTSRLESTLSSARPMNGLVRNINAASTAIKAALAGFVAGAVAQVSVEGVTSAIGDLAKLKDAADRTGLSAAAIQELSFAVEQSGGEAGDAAAAMQKFAVNSSKAAQGSGDLAKILDANGVALKDADGKLRPLVDLLNDVADLMKNASSEQDRLNIATAAFGRAGGPAMVLALSGGAKGLADFADQARKAGVVLDDKVIQKAADLDDRLATLSSQLSGIGKTIAAEFAGPVVIDALQGFLDFLRQIQFTIDAIRKGNVADALGLYYTGAYSGRTALAGSKIRAGVGTSSLTPDEISKFYDRSGAGSAGDHPDVTVGKPTRMPSDGEGGSSFGSGEAIQSYVRQVVKAESAGQADAKNPNSSATGVGQFIESTWLSLFRKYYPEQASQMGETAILALRKDADVSKTLIEKYAEENATALRNAGVAVTSANLHLAHFLGAGDATKVLTAPGGTPLRGLIRDQSIDANKSVLGGGKTTDDAIAYAGRRANDTRLAAGDKTDAEEEADKTAAAIKRVTEALQLETDQMGQTAAQQRVLQEIQAAGVDLNSAEGQAIKAKVEALYQLKDAQDATRLSAKLMAQDRKELADAGADATKGFVADLRNGVSAAEALHNAIDKLITRLTDRAIDGIFDSLFGVPQKGAPAGSGGGGLLGSLFGGGGIGSLISGLFGGFRAAGGPVSKGTPYIVGEKRPELFVPGSSGRILPNVPNLPNATSGKGPPMLRQNNTTKVTHSARIAIDLTGANGDETIRRISEEAAARGARQAYTAAIRDVPATNARYQRLRG